MGGENYSRVTVERRKLSPLRLKAAMTMGSTASKESWKERGREILHETRT